MSNTEKEMIEELYNDNEFFTASDPHTQAYSNYIDMVLKPPHYNQGSIETIDYMKAYSTKEEFMGHCRLTAIKYLSRLMGKGNPVQDAKKAIWYINKLIEELDEVNDI